MSYSFNYDTKRKSIPLFAISVTFIVFAYCMYLIGNSKAEFFNFAEKFFIAGSIYTAFVATLHLLYPKKYIELDNKIMTIYYGLPWAKKSISIPLEKIQSVEMSASPVKIYGMAGSLMIPTRMNEPQEVMAINLHSEISGHLQHKFESLSGKQFPVIIYQKNEKGKRLFVRSEPQGGFQNLIDAIKKEITIITS